MMIRFLPALAALALAAPLYAAKTPDPAADAWCPRADRDLPRGPDWHCYGRLTKHVSFAFVYPRAVERVPQLDALIRTEAGAAQTAIMAQAEEAEAEGHARSRLRYEAVWRLDAILPEIAAASGEIRRTGGGRDGIEFRAILIDRESGRTIRLADLFRAGFFESRLLWRVWGMRRVQGALCGALAAGAECPDVEDPPITLLCGPNGRIDTLRAFLPEAVDFPVNAEMMAALQARFRPAFGVRSERRARIPAAPCR
jgi:hypothetical protein